MIFKTLRLGLPVSFISYIARKEKIFGVCPETWYKTFMVKFHPRHAQWTFINPRLKSLPGSHSCTNTRHADHPGHYWLRRLCRHAHALS